MLFLRGEKRSNYRKNLAAGREKRVQRNRERAGIKPSGTGIKMWQEGVGEESLRGRKQDTGSQEPKKGTKGRTKVGGETRRGMHKSSRLLTKERGKSNSLFLWSGGRKNRALNTFIHHHMDELLGSREDSQDSHGTADGRRDEIRTCWRGVSRAGQHKRRGGGRERIFFGN